MPKIPAQSGKARAKAAEVIEQAHDLINEALPDLTQSLIDSARGLRFQDEKGNVYTKEPNVESLKRCLEIVMGKPVAKVDQTVKTEVGFEDWMMAQAEGGPMILYPDQELVVIAPPALPAPLAEAKERMEDVLADLGIDE